MVSTGIFADVIAVICENDWKEIQENTWTTINNIYKYKNSVAGIMDMLSTDYNNLNFDATEIQQKLADPDNLELLRSVLAKLG